jgi:hypothetical protein
MAFFSKLTSLVSDVKGSLAAVVSDQKTQFAVEEQKIEENKRKLAAKQCIPHTIHYHSLVCAHTLVFV